VADEVNKKGMADIIANALVRQGITHVQEVARALAIQGRHQLAGIQVSKRHDKRLGKANFIFDLG
jgi:hypothetical protein